MPYLFILTESIVSTNPTKVQETCLLLRFPKGHWGKGETGESSFYQIPSIFFPVLRISMKTQPRSTTSKRHEPACKQSAERGLNYRCFLTLTRRKISSSMGGLLWVWGAAYIPPCQVVLWGFRPSWWWPLTFGITSPGMPQGWNWWHPVQAQYVLMPPPPPSYPMLLFYLPFLRPPFFSFLFPPGDTFSVSPLPPPPFPILEGSTELRLLGLHSGRWGEADRFWRFMQVSVILIAEDVLTSCKTKTKQGSGCSRSINGS